MNYTEAENLILSLSENPDYKGAAERAWLSAASDLNSSLDHFLLELIQNADDNQYDGNDQTLSLTYTTNNHLKSYCNEKGFTKKDATAICNLYQSTKDGSRSTTGEKGIGFKSVLGVAQVAWIASAGFRFKLYANPDKALAPELFNLPFPDGSDASDKGTNMYFEIAQEKAKAVREAVEKFNPSTVLFLKQLKRIDLIIDGTSATHFVRVEQPINDESSDVTIFQSGAPVLHYRQFSFPFTATIGRAGKRENKSSHIKFAFPVVDNFQSIIDRDEKVYACLPIKHFGFKFALHANFLLATSREEIHENSDWNKELREAICEKFAYTIEQLNQDDSDLWSTWPQLLAGSEHHNDFFKFLNAKIWEKLKTRQILRTEDGKRVAPSSNLCFFPPKWRLEPDNRTPIPWSKNRLYLSSKYDSECTEIIKQVDVREIGPYEFWSDLRDHCKDTVPEEENWHISIAKMFNKDLWFRGYCEDVNLIPVRKHQDGEISWVSKRTANDSLLITLGYDGRLSTLPSGIGLLFIPDDAAQNEDRRRFFEAHGAKIVTPVIKHIGLRLHDAHSKFDPEESKEWTTADLVTHLHFLFKHQDVSPPRKFWVAVESGPPQLASEAFAKPIEYGGHQLQVPVLHSDYLAGLDEKDKEKLLIWLRETFRMPLRPRLAASKGDILMLSPEMKFIAENFDSIHFLNLLKYHQITYTHQLKPGLKKFEARLWQEIASTTIRYLDTTDASQPPISIRLGESMLPTIATEKLQSQVSLPLLPIPSPCGPEWRFLEWFGVKLEPDYTHWLLCLKKIKSLDVETPKEKDTQDPQSKILQTQGLTQRRFRWMSMISTIYAKLLQACELDEKRSIMSEVRKTFNSEALIFIPPTWDPEHKHTWAYPSECVWRVPAGLDLRQSFCLTRFNLYYNHFNFACKVLRVEKTTDLSRLRREAEQLSDNSDLNSPKTLNYFGKLFEEMSVMISSPDQLGGDMDEEREKLFKCAMLPVRQLDSEHQIKLVAAADKVEWFIADREILLKSFMFKAPLLALETSWIERCHRLLSLLKLESRKLSVLAIAVPLAGTADEQMQAKKWEMWAKHIDRVTWSPLFFDGPQPPPLAQTRIRVLSSNTIPVRWEVQGLQGTYIGTIHNRVAVAALRGDEFSIYVQKNSLSSNRSLMEISDDICDIYRISEDRRLLVPYIIGTENSDEIENILELKGFPKRPAWIRDFWENRRQKLNGYENTIEQDENQETTNYKIGPPESSLEPPIASYQIFPQDAVGQTKTHNTMNHTEHKDTASKDRPNSMHNHHKQEVVASKEPVSHVENTNNTNNSQMDSRVEEPTTQKKITDKAPEIHFPKDGKKTKATKPPSAPSVEARSARDRKLTTQSQDDSAIPTSQNKKRNQLAVPPQESRPRSASASAGRGPKKMAIRSQATPSSPTSTSESRESRPARKPEVGFVSMDLGMVYFPSISSSSTDDSQISKYYGELYVSRFLSSFLPLGAYDMDAHWTSEMKSRHGRGPFTPETNVEYATFTIPETRGRMREYVIQQCQLSDSWIAEACTFHIQVCITEGDLGSSFVLSSRQRKKAESMSLQEGSKGEHVYILARVYNVRTDPVIALFVDPWPLNGGGCTEFEPAMVYNGKISSTASALHIESCSNQGPGVNDAGKIYKDLEIDETNIRLLELEPSDDSGSQQENRPLKVKLTRRSMSPPVPFWAISYVWGYMPSKHGPFLDVTNEENNNRALIPVTESLWSCLRCLQRKGITVALWADAICINQEDSVEKAIQVRRMGTLYGKAEQVVIWTGNGREEDSGVIEWLDSLHMRSKEAPPLISAGYKEDLTRMASRVDTFLQRSWFRRTWTIQELVFGTRVKVMAGDSEIEWDAFMKGVNECEERMQHLYGKQGQDPQRILTNSEPALALGLTRQYYRNSHPGETGRELRYSFLKLIELFYYTGSSEPRDKMFALLNLAYDTPMEKTVFWPDYKSNEEVILSRYGKEFVRAGKALDLMYHAGDDKGSPFCSWIPDLMNMRSRKQYAPSLSTWEAFGRKDTNESGFCAGEWFRVEASVLSPEESGLSTSVGSKRVPVLAVTGKMFDCIKTFESLTVSGGGRLLPIGENIAILRRNVFPLHYYPNMGQEWKDELMFKCLIGDAGAEKADAPLRIPMETAQRKPTPKACWPKGFEGLVLNAQPGQDAREYMNKLAEDRDTVERFWETAAAFLQRIPGAAVCTTSKGYAGIVPGTAAANDKIFLPRGSKVPFVVRMCEQTSTGKKHYRLVGECYVHGIMYYEDISVKALGDEVVHLV